MPSPFADDHSPINPSVEDEGLEPQSRTGKFLQGIFKRSSENTPEAAESVVDRISEQPDLIQVMPEDSNWDDGEDSNWDDDFMYEPKASRPAPQLAVPPAVETSPPETPPPVQAAPPPPAAVPEVTVLPNNQPVSVNIPRPKNIKYKNKDQVQSAVAKSVPVVSPEKSEKTEPIEFNVQRPKTIKYKAKPIEQDGWLAKILAPGRAMWRKILVWGDVIPTQLTENPRKILGILAAVGLSIVTSWVVVNFWPSSSSSLPIATKPPVITSAGTAAVSPEEALISAVRSQLSTLASQYPAGLISNLELDNERQLATVTLGNLWASLPGEQQQQVAQSLWQQARTYQMAKVEIRSNTGNLLARSPVVGSDMVVISNW